MRTGLPIGLLVVSIEKGFHRPHKIGVKWNINIFLYKSMVKWNINIFLNVSILTTWGKRLIDIHILD